MKMNLFGYAINPYQPAEYCAYLYYSKKEKDEQGKLIDVPTDHLGKTIGNFSSDEKSSAEFVEHLNHKVIPKLNKSMLHSAFHATEVIYINNAPQPIIAIWRKDKAPVSEQDSIEITKLLENGIKPKANQHLDLFKNHIKKQLNKTENKVVSHYNLRHKK